MSTAVAQCVVCLQVREGGLARAWCPGALYEEFGSWGLKESVFGRKMKSRPANSNHLEAARQQKGGREDARRKR